MDLLLEQGLKQKLTPQMELSVRILQMDAVQLGEYIQQVSIENSLVELDAPPSGAQESREELNLRKLEWLEEQTVRSGENTGYYEEDEAFDPIEERVCAGNAQTLTDHLLAQLLFAELSGVTPALVGYVIGCLDDNGYLTASDEVMCEEAQVSPAELQAAISIVRGFDPEGVGARTLGECLCLQLREDDEVARRLVSEFLPDLLQPVRTQLARRMQVTDQLLEAAIGRVRRLNPKPGALYAAPDPPAYITPDILVTCFEEQYNVMLREFSYPQLRLNKSYLEMAKQTQDHELKEYISEKANQIFWIQRCIQKRGETLLAVARAIVRRQERFFRFGPRYLNVLSMKEIARMADIHESTVSRAVSGKYLQCAHGVFALRHFFVQSVGAAGEGASSHTIKWEIKTLITQEDTAAPLSDQQLAECLQERGMPIARRTVAKYREELGFDKAAKRRR